MRLTTLLASLCISTPLFAESEDFINFGNDDTLHGEFRGLTTSGKIIWKNESAQKNIAFDTAKVRKIVINGGKLKKPFTHISYVTLNNKDIIPGKITNLSANHLTLTTDYAGTITIPREHIASINFTPAGNKIIYRGPYTTDGWKSIPLTKDLPEPDDKNARWEFKNFSWSNRSKPAVLMNDLDLPDMFRLTFKKKFVSSSYITAVLFADGKKPENLKLTQTENISQTTALLQNVGNSLSLRLSPYTPSLTLNNVDEKGKPLLTTIKNKIQYRGNSKTSKYSTYDIRYDGKTKFLYAYRNNVLGGKWDLSNYSEILKGKKLGFANIYSNTGVNKFSDIVITSWNGVLKPATSMKNKDRDTMLLTNGTDRYSGNVEGFINNAVKLKSSFAELTIPTDKIRSLNFATKNIAESIGRKKNEISLRFFGTGKITGKLTKGTDGNLTLESSILGKLTLKSEFISAYEFEDIDYLYEIQN